MTIFLLSNANSYHTKRWVIELKDRGYEVVLYSIERSKDDFYSKRNIIIHSSGLKSSKKRGWIYSFLKLYYLVSLFQIVLIKKRYNPDIIHSHYATSYGLFGAIIKGKTSFVLSVWGSDVFNFPRKSILHKCLLKAVLYRTDHITGTSRALALETRKYTRKEVIVVPFGVDSSLYKFSFSLENSVKMKTIKLINVKQLEPIYNQKEIILSVKILQDKFPDFSFQLVIIGEGAQQQNLMNLVHQLQLDKAVKFIQNIPNEELPQYYNNADIAIFPTIANESFGVVILESIASGLPVLMSKTPGYLELSSNGQYTHLLENTDAAEIANSVKFCIENVNIAHQKTIDGYKAFKKNYDWHKNVSIMESIYKYLSQN